MFIVAVLLAVAGNSMAYAAELNLTAEERDWIESNPIIRVHNETDWPPFNFAVDGIPQGYSIDYMNLLAERTGLTVEYVTGPSWNEFLDMMRDGSLDVMLNIVKTPDRQEYLLYTPPYADNPNTILSRKGDGFDSLEQLLGKTVSVPKGFFYEEILTREFPDIKLHLVKGTLESMKAVTFGKADAAVGELAVFGHLLEEHSMTGLAVSGEVKMGDPELSLLNIATRKDLPVLISILRKGVASITLEEKNEIRNKWISVHHGLGIDVKLVLQVGGIGGIILVIFIVWNRRLQAEVTQRKRVENQLRLALDNMPGGIRYIDRDEKILLINSQYRELWGFPDDFPVIGNTIQDEYEFQWGRGDFGEGDKDDLVARERAPYPVNQESERYERTSATGRVIEVLGQSSESGDYVNIYTDITERKNSENQLKEARDKAADAGALLRAVLDSMPGGVRYIDDDEKILLLNKKYQELWGYPDDFPKIGDTVTDEYNYHWAQGDFGDGDRDELVAKVRASFPWVVGEESYERETRTGRVLEIRGQSAEIGGFVTIYTDVTERKHAEQEIEKARDKAAEAEELFKDAINNISDGFVLYDSTDHLVICNDHFRNLYQFSEDIVANHPSWVDLENYDAERNIIEWESDGEVPRGERRWDDFQRKLTDGRWVDIRQRRTAFGGMVCIHMDITNQKRAAEIMEQARDEAERIADAKSEFVAMVSHEVRTPMNGVLGMARLLLDGELNGEQRDIGETIVRSGDALLTIVNDLLDVSKLEAGRLELEAIPFSPHDLISQTVAAATARATEKGLELNTWIGEKLPPVVIGDPNRIRQILINLLDNAAKFTEAGSVSLTADAVLTGSESADIIFDVCDTGPGMAPEIQEKVFAPYSQAAIEVARKYGGTGLGLTICRRLAGLMGGVIRLDSTLGAGSTFRVRIPMPVDTKTSLESLMSYRDQHGPALPKALVQLRILQVEDDATNRQVAERSLVRAGHVVTNVENGLEAINALENDGFDLVLMDRHMPVMDGIKATKLIRKMVGPVASIPIVGITAGATEHEIEACIASGMDTCLTKPVNPRILVETVHRFGAKDSTPLSIGEDRRFLFVDDDQIARDVATRQFAKLGRECDTAASGAEALQLVQVHEYGAVFTDITMPGMDGIELTGRLRQREQETAEYIPIIAVTGHVSLEDRKRFLAAGMDDVIIKPVTVEKLAAMIGGDVEPAVLKDARPSPIDLTQLAEILGDDDPEEIAAHITLFMDHFPALLNDLVTTVKGENRQAIRDSAHAAKSAASYTAAVDLSSMLQEMEKSAPDGKLVELRSLLKEIEKAFKAIEDFSTSLCD